MKEINIRPAEGGRGSKSKVQIMQLRKKWSFKEERILLTKIKGEYKRKGRLERTKEWQGMKMKRE